MNLYTALVEQETRKFRDALDRINSHLPAINRAERIKRCLNDAGLPAALRTQQGSIPYLVLPMAIEQLPQLDATLGKVETSLSRKLIPNGTARYMVEAREDEAHMAEFELFIEEI